MQSHVQRRRQQGVFQPRQPRNDVNAGAMPVAETETQVPAPEASPKERQDHYAKRCAQRDLI
jgi:hypothetical protein